jgi:putative peptidoglycan lipid II flippase
MGFQAPHILLATSTCVSSAVNAFLLWRGLIKQGVYQPSRAWSRLLPRVALACLVMGLLLWWWSSDLDYWMALHPVQRLLRCAVGITAGAGAYFAVLLALGVRYRDLRTRPA